MAVHAAGSSKRFGKKDKLAQPFRGRLLGEHVCANAPVDRIAQGCALIITANKDHPCRAGWEKAGFQIALNARAEEGMGTSVALAQKERCDAVLIALADMPLVPRAHFDGLIDSARTRGACWASDTGAARTPPAIFGQSHFAELARLNEDTGARALLKNARAVSCPPQWLEDIDTPEALARLS